MPQLIRTELAWAKLLKMQHIDSYSRSLNGGIVVLTGVHVGRQGVWIYFIASFAFAENKKSLSTMLGRF